jgi:hypothetical protein
MNAARSHEVWVGTLSSAAAVALVVNVVSAGQLTWWCSISLVLSASCLLFILLLIRIRSDAHYMCEESLREKPAGKSESEIADEVFGSFRREANWFAGLGLAFWLAATAAIYYSNSLAAKESKEERQELVREIRQRCAAVESPVWVRSQAVGGFSRQGGPDAAVERSGAVGAQ